MSAVVDVFMMSSSSQKNIWNIYMGIYIYIYHHPALVPQRLKFDASVGAEWATPQVLNEATLSVDFPEAPVVCGSRMVWWFDVYGCLKGG